MPAKLKNPVNHFWSNVSRREPANCWVWKMGTNGRYGTFYPLEKQLGEVVAHRIAFILSRGTIPDGLEVCHNCDNPICCNPSHLFLATHKENMQDMVSKGRQAKLKGELHGESKLTNASVKEIRRLAPKISQRVLAHRFGVTKRVIHNVIKRKSWNHVP